jgi:proteasome lid subunit RPN8/RPN11
MSAKNVKVKIKVQPVVVMEAEVARKIRQHSRSSMKAEVCGVLIGSTDDDRTVIEACIAGINAAQGGAHVTFTQDTWEHIFKIKDQQYPDAKIVGWYHSHPGFGVFLSEHDLFIQENFFSSPQQVAWVYDPHTDEEGCFGWVGGKIEKLTGLRFGYSQSVEIDNSNVNEYEEDGTSEMETAPPPRRRSDSEGRPEPAWVKWVNRVMITISLLILGFFGGFMFEGRQVVPLRQALEERVIFLQQMQLQCQPELRSCFSKFGASPLAPGSTSDAGPGFQSPPPSSQPQQKAPEQKAPAKSGEGNNGKH